MEEYDSRNLIASNNNNNNKSNNISNNNPPSDLNIVSNPSGNQKKEKKSHSSANQGELNFKKWLLSLSSIANLILSGLLLIMVISAMRFNLSSIFIADRALLIISIILVICPISIFISICISSYFTLLLIFYLYILSMVVLSVFALSTISMNDIIINYIDTHWDIIRNSVENFDMEKFKQHVTTEINSLGIFSMTLNALILVSLFCITNFLKIKNIIFALTPSLNLIFSCLSLGLMSIGIYTYNHCFYSHMSRWTCVLIVILGCIFFFIGVYGYFGIKVINKQKMKIHLIYLSISVIALIAAGIIVFNANGFVKEHINKNWEEIGKKLEEEGYKIRESYVINELQANYKLTAFYIIGFAAFSIVSWGMSMHQYFNIEKLIKLTEEDNN